ncbi:MAG: low molecular weight protein arginine phosphatase [Gemmatimonadetes bacterium]|nr:low molecular weight protein arginine phosphatase [Gemmatimonadota bacterium]
MPESEGRPAESEPTTFNLLFVCTGNTCRSPLACAIARRAIERRGWKHVSVESAGVAAGEGIPASDAAVRVAAERGLDLGTHSSRVLTPEWVDWADLVLVMSPSQEEVVLELGGTGKVSLLGDFIDGEGSGEAIEDPFGGGEERYRRTFDRLESAVAGLLSRLATILAP